MLRKEIVLKQNLRKKIKIKVAVELQQQKRLFKIISEGDNSHHHVKLKTVKRMYLPLVVNIDPPHLYKETIQ
jgi:hypothetical protein